MEGGDGKTVMQQWQLNGLLGWLFDFDMQMVACAVAGLGINLPSTSFFSVGLSAKFGSQGYFGSRSALGQFVCGLMDEGGVWKQ